MEGLLIQAELEDWRKKIVDYLLISWLSVVVVIYLIFLKLKINCIKT